LQVDVNVAVPRPRYNYVEGIRALACLTVVLNHAVAEAFPVLYHVDIPPMLSFLKLWFAFGHHAVTAFIVVSGFCLGVPLAGADFLKPVAFGQFMARRIARIVPPYYVALVISLLVCYTMFKFPSGMHFDFSAHPRPSDIAAHFLLIQNVFGTGQINYSFWSIATELHIYMLFPFLVAMLRKRNGWMAVGAIAVVAYGISYIVMDTRLDRAAIHFVGAFICGIAASWVTRSEHPVAERLRAFSAWSLVALGGLAGIAFWTKSLPFAQYQALQLAQDSVVMLAITALLIACTKVKSPLRVLLEAKPLVWIGERSYSLYLLHVPIQAALLKVAISMFDLTHTERLVFSLTFGFAILLGMTWIFHKVVEVPAMAFSRGLGKQTRLAKA
jgi:peptidoglycan/LPS O-acetylase OafA/YrhL